MANPLAAEFRETSIELAYRILGSLTGLRRSYRHSNQGRAHFTQFFSIQ
jgi:hypothetical protein